MADTIQKTTTKNGIRVITKDMPHVRSVSLGIWVNIGARDETLYNNGACHFIEHMIFKGTEKRSAYDIASEMDAMGGHSNAFTAMEHTCYHGKVLDSQLPRLLDILSDIFLHSVFDPIELERERSVIIQEVQMVEETPEDYLHHMAQAAFYQDHPLGRSILGPIENLTRFDAHILKEQQKTWYQPERIIIAAAGHIDHDSFVSRILSTFGKVSRGVPSPKRKKPDSPPKTAIESKDIEQVHFCLATRGLPANDPRRYAYSLLNILLGGNMSSRLFQQIRERNGLAYSVYSFANAYSDSGMLGVYAAVRPEDTQRVLELTTREIRRFKDKPVDHRELAGAKDYVKGSIYLSAESTNNQMLRLAQNEVHFERHIPLSEVSEKIDEVTPKMIQTLAHEIFLENEMCLALLGPLNKKDWKGFQLGTSQTGTGSSRAREKRRFSIRSGEKKKTT